jgi:hypothetical protein
MSHKIDDSFVRGGAIALVLAGSFLAASGPAAAQSLNWEGQTGVFITPLAYTAGSPEDSAGKPVVAYHYLNGGKVLGGFHTVSITEGFAKRIEVGYTSVYQRQASTPGLSSLWNDGFHIVHGKATLVPENAGKQNWLPAIAVGAVGRFHDSNVSGAIKNTHYNNADFYVVASKTVTQVKGLPFVLNLGYKATNAQVFGLAGNAPAYKGRLFGAVAFVFKGPSGSQIILGSEFAQEPRQVRNLPGAVVPTTITYAARIVPSPKHARFNIDFGVAQAASWILPSVNLQARHQFALGLSYGL